MHKQLNKYEKLQNLATSVKEKKKGGRKKVKVLSIITSGQNKQNLLYHFKDKIRLLTNWHSSSMLPGSTAHGNINFMAFIYLFIWVHGKDRVVPFNTRDIKIYTLF